MKTRVDAGTDIAMVGAWDASLNDSPLARTPIKQLVTALETDAAAGHLFLIHTGADGGGPIDVFVESEIPPELQKQFRPVKGEFLISVPTGRLVVGGVEDYRSGRKQTTSETSIVTVPPGDYALRCYIGKDEGGFDPPSRSALEKAIGNEDHRYYRRIQNTALLAYFTTPLLFISLAFFLRWKLALVITVIVASGGYFGLKQWLRRNERFKRVAKAVNDLWLQAKLGESAGFIFVLRRLAYRTGLRGGSIHLDKL